MPVRPKSRTRSVAESRPSEPPREPAALADWSIATSARDRLPAELHIAHDAVLDAFTLYATGQDEAARERLHTIGLSSPFLEWKLLLRGLMAYSIGDDGRALDNWGRLTADRVPARIAAPLRAAIDPTYRAGQPPARQAKLREAADRLTGGVLAPLRAIQADLGRPERLPLALKAIERLLPASRAAQPGLESILERCSYSAAAQGHPQGAWLHKQVFGPPADDPTLSRLQALAAEARREWASANRHWQHFESSLSENAAWLAEDCTRARALIWLRCGDNSSRAEAEERHPSMRPKPGPESCYRKALTIDPMLRDAYRNLFDLYRDRAPEKALAVGRKCIARFPDDAQALIGVAEIAQESDQLDLALDCLSRARSLDPFNRSLKHSAAILHRSRARRHLAANRLDEADNDLLEAGKDSDSQAVTLLAQRAILALKRGDQAAGDEFATRARSLNPTAAAFAMCAEAAHAKLSRPARKPFDADMEQALSARIDAVSAMRLAEVLLEHEIDAATYVGFKSHKSKALRCIERVDARIAAPQTCERLCELLDNLEAGKLLRRVAASAAIWHPRDPAFPFFEAKSFVIDEQLRSAWRVDRLLDRARHLARALPAGDARARHYLAASAELESELAELTTSRLPVELLDHLQDILDL